MCSQGMLLGARSGAVPEFYGFIILTHTTCSFAVGLLSTCLFLLFYSWNSRADLSKVNRPVQKAQETAWLLSMNFNALRTTTYNAIFILDSSSQSAPFR